MRRCTIGLFALTLLATACGSSDSNEDVLVALGLNETEAECFDREYSDRGLDMNTLLTADTDDLSSQELQAVLDVAAICSGDSGETGPSSDEDRSYDDLSVLEQAFVDGVTESGGTEEVGICMLDELDAAGISILDLAALGLEEDAEPSEEFMTAIFRCGDELAASGIFDDADGLFSNSADGDDYGDNPELDALHDACTAGDAEACDELYWSSPIGSAYEAYGNTCGDRFPSGVVTCVSAMGDAEPTGPMSYGDDPRLDALQDRCETGDLEACDELWLTSPIGSAYESYGSTCGGRTSETFGNCVITLGG